MYCLRRYDKVANLPLLVVGYTEQVTSVPFEMNGTVAATIFVKNIHTKNRAVKIGWKDETEEYNKYINWKKLHKKRKESVVESFSSTEKETKVKRKTRKK